MWAGSPRRRGAGARPQESESVQLRTNDFTALFLNVRPEKATFRDRDRATGDRKGDRPWSQRPAARGRRARALSDGVVPQASWAYIREITRYTRSLEEAKTLHRMMRTGRSRLRRHPRPAPESSLSFAITTSSEPAARGAALQIADDISAIGMRVELKAMPFTALIETAARERTYDALLIGISVSGDPDPYSFFHSPRQGPGHNFSGINAHMDEVSRPRGERRIRVNGASCTRRCSKTIATEVPVVSSTSATTVGAGRAGQGLKIARSGST